MAIVRTRQNSLYGFPGAQINQFPSPVVIDRDPTAADEGELGQLWVNTVAQSAFVCVAINGGNVWAVAPSGATTAAAMTVNPGDLTVTAGNVIVTAGDVNVGAGTVNAFALAAGNTTVSGTLGVSGASTMANLAITGNLTVTGDFDFTDTASISLISTNNAAGAITIQANGGATETVILRSLQGTSATSVNISSTDGGVSLTGGKATAAALNLVAGDAAGGITATAGTGGVTVTTTNGAIAINSGTAALGLSTDASDTTISVGTGAAEKTVILGSTDTTSTTTVDCGTGGAFFGTTANAHLTTVGSPTGNSVTVVSCGTGGANFGVSANAHLTTVGSTFTTSATTVQSGTGDVVVTSADAILLDAVGVLELNSSGGAIGIGNDAVARGIDIGTGFANRNIAVGNSSADSNLTLRGGGAGGFGGGGITLEVAVTGGIYLNAAGIVAMTPAVSSSATSTNIIDANVGVATYTGFTTAASASQVFVITNSLVNAVSAIFVSCSNVGANDAQMTVTRVKPEAGTFSVTTLNNGAAALNGDVIITFWMIV